MNSALLAMYREAAQHMLDKNRDKTIRIANSFRNLDDDGLANSNFGISLDNTAGLIVGVGQSIGLGMDLSPSNGSYKFALVQGQSISSGLQADITTGVSVFWSPGSINESEGASVGLAVELALEGGAGVGMSWGVGANITKISPVPGLSLALVGGVSVKADLVGGYTWIVQKVQIPPMQKSAGTTGGNGGSPWSDSPKCEGQYVSGFKIASGARIDGVQFKYGTRGWAEPYGNSNFNTEVNLRPGEYIAGAAVVPGKGIDGLTFFTNKSAVLGPYGRSSTAASNYIPPRGERLGCVSGRAQKELDQITFNSAGGNF